MKKITKFLVIMIIASANFVLADASSPSEILSLPVNKEELVVNAHYNLNENDVGSILNFVVTSSTYGQLYSSSTVATTTGEFYYSWTFPAPSATNSGQDIFYFYADIIKDSTVLHDLNVAAYMDTSVIGYPGYSTPESDSSIRIGSSVNYLIQSLGRGLSGSLNRIDVQTSNPVDYYGSRPFIRLVECDSDTITESICNIIYQGTSDDLSLMGTSTQRFYFDPPLVLKPEKYYYFKTSGNNQYNVLVYYLGTKSDTVDGECYHVSYTQTIPCLNVSDLYFRLYGITKEEPPEPEGYSSVLFLPGLEASRLYLDEEGSENQLWEPAGNDESTRKLFMDGNGMAIREGVYTKEVIDNAYVPIKGNVYKSFLEQLDTMKNADKIIDDYSIIPYDWRLSLEDILSNGTKDLNGRLYYSGTSGATSTPYIIQELRRLAENSRTGKVTIVAHSNGGLITKALTNKLGDEASQLIDKIIFVAVPQVGTPKAIGAILHGFEQSLPIKTFSTFGISQLTARDFALNMPSAYNLLPSAQYFTYVDDPVITFDDNPLLSEWRQKYGVEIHSGERLHNFLTDQMRTTLLTTNILKYPVIGNRVLLNSAESVHTILDNWVPPLGIEITEIAGWGKDTLSKIIYYQGLRKMCNANLSICQDTPVLEYKPVTVIDGDGTVLVPSALWLPESSQVKKYWVNLADYGKWWSNGNITRKHADILEIPQLHDLIKNIIKNTTDIIPEYITTSIPINEGTQTTHLNFTLHSPLLIDVYDDFGNHTGFSSSTNMVEENIPESQLLTFGEVTRISVPSSTHTRIFMNGTETGSFTFDIDKIENNMVTASTTFSGIPVFDGSMISMDVPQDIDIQNILGLSIDFNGDGEVDRLLPPKLNNTTLLDTTPPITIATTTGIIGKNGWYTSDVQLQLTASDLNSEIADTKYSLDDGGTWLSYSTTTPVNITNEGINLIQFYSSDTMGNKEIATSTLVKIDKTAPEATITFDPKNQKLNIIGIDNLSSTTIATTNLFGLLKPFSTTVTDEAGHTLEIIYQKPIFMNTGKNINLLIQKLVYDNVSKTFPIGIMSFNWQTGKDNTYKTFIERFIVGKTIWKGDFDSKKNITKITKMIFTGRDTDSDRQRFELAGYDKKNVVHEIKPGLIIFNLVTNKGELIINY